MIGEDTRKTFISHLYNALCRKKIATYKDDEKLKIGDEIPGGLFEAIKESKMAIVVFSKTYAFSSWCLSELNHIVQCRKKSRYCIIPVFYDVDPSHVRSQKESYADAFLKHEKDSKHTVADIEAWKGALKSAANLTGLDSRLVRSDAELVDRIVKDVLKKLNCLSPVSNDDLNNLIGIGNQIKKIQRELFDRSPEERIIGIWGIGGIGKTTLASVVFDRVSSQFDRCYFLPNVSEGLKKNGLTNLQEKLFAALLEKDSVNIGTPSLISSSGQERLRNTKALIVLDDVTSAVQFDQVLLRRSTEERLPQFGDGSRIIVTTRDFQVLESIDAIKKYEVKQLNDRCALKLFRSYALPKVSDATKYAELSNKVVKNYANGIPLALKVFGLFLRSKSHSEWKVEIEKLERVPNQEIQDLFKITSYDGLDNESKEIFLDIAAFFKGEDRCFVESVLDGCKFSANTGIKKLNKKSLITIRRHNKLWMHNLVQQMGQEIVREKWKRHGKRCRLWETEDIREVLATDTEREAVRGIFLDVTKIKHRLDLSSAVFSMMRNLRFLKIYKSGHVEQTKVHLSQKGLESLPESLVYLHWHGYPLNCLPSDFTPTNLVELGMPYSKVEKLWNKNKNLGNLKRIDLSYSKKLTQIPDLSSASNVESINLEHCRSLPQVFLSQNLLKLTSLNLNGCSSLDNISELPTNIAYLNIKNCSRLQSIPANICELNSLCTLNLSGCLNLKDFPEISRPMECLIELILDRTAIENLPSSIKMLTALKTLSMNMCENLETLPNSIADLDYLQSLSICHCPKLERLPALPPSLASVDARNCVALQNVCSSKVVPEVGNCSHHINGGTFIFYNCLNLDSNAQDNIMADAQRIIMRIANITSKCGGDPYMTEICWPGNKIPAWFEHRLEESSINVTSSSNKFDGTFIGFVLCVVVDFKDCNLDGDFKIYYEATCSFPDGSKTTWCHTWIWHWNHHRSNNERDESQKKENGTTEIACRSVNSPHVFLFYDNGRQVRTSLRAKKEMSSSSSADDKNVSVTFEFHPTDSNGRVNSSNFQVKSCGLRLLCSDDIRYLGCLSQDEEESAGEDSEKSVVAGGGVEEIAQEDEEDVVNQPDLQRNGPHPEENDEKNLTSCCLELRSQLLEFCNRSGTGSSGRLHGGLRNDMRRETSNLRVNPSQSVAVLQLPSSAYNRLIEEVVNLRNEYREINQRLDHLIMMQCSPSRQFNTQLQGISSGGSRND